VAEVTEEQQTTEEQTETIKVVEKKSRAGLWFGIILTLCVIVLSGAGFYLLQQLREHQDTLSTQDNQKLIEMSKQINGFQAQIAAMQSQLATLDADITGKEQHFNQALSEFTKVQNIKLETVKKDLTEQIERLQRQLGKTRGDWLIADAEYLLSVANERLHLAGDINTTREALEAADQRLRESGDAAVFKVREEISKELAALRSVQKPDIVGLYARVQTLKERIPQLSVLLPYAGKELTTKTPIHQHEKPSEEHNVLSKVIDQLDDYVVVRHSDKPVGEILTPQQAQFIREQLAIKLEMVKVALVQQNDDLYQLAIKDAEKWLKENFAMNDAGKSFLKALQSLAQVNMKGHYPDIHKSLTLLKSISRLRLEKDKALGRGEKTVKTAAEPSLITKPTEKDTEMPEPAVTGPEIEQQVN
jgi:uncharacterized protein HemX